MNYLLSNNKIHADYVKNYTNASFLIKEGFEFKDGLFSGYNEGKRDLRPVELGATRSARTVTPSSTSRCRTRAACSSC